MTQQADAGLNLQHFKELKQTVNTEIQTYAVALKNKPSLISTKYHNVKI